MINRRASGGYPNRLFVWVALKGVSSAFIGFLIKFAETYLLTALKPDGCIGNLSDFLFPVGAPIGVREIALRALGTCSNLWTYNAYI